MTTKMNSAMYSAIEFKLKILSTSDLHDISGEPVKISPGEKRILLNGSVECNDESEDGTDIVWIMVCITDCENREIHITYQKMADWFFDQMLNAENRSLIYKHENAPSQWIKSFKLKCILSDAKAMRDDRKYITFIVDDEEIEINVKYQYFKVDLALLDALVPSIIVSISGLYDLAGDQITPLMYEISIADFVNSKCEK